MGGCASKGSVVPLGQVGANAQSVDLYAAARDLTLAQAQGDSRRLCLICWDIENVRLPAATAGLTPRDVVRYLKRAFIVGEARTEFKTVAALTQRSLARIEQDHPGFVDEVCGDMALLLASAHHQKRNADVALKRELSLFTHEFAGRARGAGPTGGAPLIVLLTGDEDFLEPVQRALQQGFDVQLVHHDNAARPLVNQPYTRPPILWSHFLRTASRQSNLLLPGSDENVTQLLLQLAGSDRQRWVKASEGHDQQVHTANAVCADLSSQNGSMGDTAAGVHPCAAFLVLTGLPSKWGVARVRSALQQVIPSYTSSPSQSSGGPGPDLQRQAPAADTAAAGPGQARAQALGVLHMMEPQKGHHPVVAIISLPPGSSPTSVAAARMRINAATRSSNVGSTLHVWAPWEVVHVQLEVEAQAAGKMAGTVVPATAVSSATAPYQERAYEAQASAAHELVDVCRSAGAQLLAQFAGCPSPSSATSSLLFLIADPSSSSSGGVVDRTGMSHGGRARAQGTWQGGGGTATTGQLLDLINSQLPGLTARHGVVRMSARVLCASISPADMAAAAAAASTPLVPNTPSKDPGKPGQQPAAHATPMSPSTRAPLFMQNGDMDSHGAQASNRTVPVAAETAAVGASSSPKRKRNKKKNRNKYSNEQHSAEAAPHAAGAKRAQGAGYGVDQAAGTEIDGPASSGTLVSAGSTWAADAPGARQTAELAGEDDTDEGEGHTAHSNLTRFGEPGAAQPVPGQAAGADVTGYL